MCLSAEARKGIRFLIAGVIASTVSCPQCRCWEPSPDPLLGQQALLASESSLQLLSSVFNHGVLMLVLILDLLGKCSSFFSVSPKQRRKGSRGIESIMVRKM